MLISTATLDALRASFSAQFKAAFSEAVAWTDQLTMKVPSSTKSTTFGWTERVGKPREWFGDREILNAQARDYVMTSRDFEMTIGLDRNDIEDDNLGIFETTQIPELAYGFRKHPDAVFMDLLQSNPILFPNGDKVCYDGKAFFANDHAYGPDDSPSTIDNLESLALDATNFVTAYTKMVSYQDGFGRSLMSRPTHIIVPSQLKKAALDIVSATLTGGGNTNTLVNWVQVIEAEELNNDPTAWYLADLSKPVKPLVHMTRKSPEFVSKDNLTDDNVFFQKKFLYGVDSRDAFGFSLPHLMLKSKP